MKVNRQPLEVMGEDVVKKDHDFWSLYSERMSGNWITYDTPVKEIADFALRVYQHHDYTGFKGNRRFIRDAQAQQAFSKLRSSIGGVYDWRAFHPNTKDPLEQQRMIKEADFAYRQAFALCPYSPEAVYRYVILLVKLGRLDDALLVAKTCFEFDPKNGGVEGLVHQVEEMKKGTPTQATSQPPTAAQMKMVLEETQKQFRDHPDDFQAGFNLASVYVQMQQPDKAVETLDHILNHPKVNQNAVLAVAKVYSQLGNYPKLETALEKLTKLDPGSPETWYDYAAIKVFLGKPAESLPALRRSMEENAKRLAKDPKSPDLAAKARADASFNALHSLPEFNQIVK